MQRPANESSEPYEPLLHDLRKLQALVRDSSKPAELEVEVRTLRIALKDLQLHNAVFRHLALTSPQYTVALIDDLVYRAGNDGDFTHVAELLGRLAYDEARKLVPPAVARRLEAGDVDYGDWFRMADLLNYLGLYDELRELVAKARDHIDGDVRELADTYGEV